MYRIGRLGVGNPSTRKLWVRHLQQLSSPELRSRFVQYFEKHGHTPVKSASLIPHNDKTLLFTNAGMVPFKEHFLKPGAAPYKSATSVQKCMRAGGKHNDLDNVGYTPRHHTFFEMLGNFSFGGYGKEDAIKLAWRFLVEELELPVDRLRVTVLDTDEVGYALWKKQGLPDEKIVRCGAEDNFWSMGDGEGPCGSCTEIFWDTQDPSLSEEDRWLEIWNLVFMEKYRTADNKLTDLPVSCIDTGMGLERMASVLQGKKNNFQTDQFLHLIQGIRENLQSRNIPVVLSEDPSAHEKIIADHFRAMCFLISDGVVPSNVGRGYVLRRIIRRALRSAKQLGINEPFLTGLYPYLLQGFSDGSYPELTERGASICNIVQNEEAAFLTTLDRGLALLNNVFAQPNLQHTKQIPPQIAFQLYDTFGFPFDLTLNIALEKGWTIDMKAVEELKEKQRQMGKESWKSEGALDKGRFAEWRNQNILSRFTGYDRALLDQESQIVAVDMHKKGKKTLITMAIDPCPFYGLGGGQVPDSGVITLANGQEWHVVDVLQPYEGGLVLSVAPSDPKRNIEKSFEEDKEFLQSGNLVRAQVDLDKRQGAEVHHTATHMLNAGLRSILKTDIVQAGSMVEPKKLRFDFTYGKPLTTEQLQAIENWVNQTAVSGGETNVKMMSLTDAVSSGAIAAFSEKYGETVRVIEVPGVSRELCGGTHVDDIRRLYPFKILSETSVAAGTRRIEAVAGLSCVDWYRKAYQPVPDLLKLLRANDTQDGVIKLDKALQQTKVLQKRLETLTEKLARAGETVVHPVEAQIKDVPVRIHMVDADLDVTFMQKRARVLKESQGEWAHVLVNKNTIMVALDPSQVQSETANSILKHMLRHIKGGGGGQKDFAQGKLATPITSVQDIESNLVPALTAL